mmetsp:Transcript_38971/g.122870  ORF Transcript_38971/g.122870 Transcript_38971/m.122870 type:complete len:294 (+) Transcript_38971:3-884(+)
MQTLPRGRHTCHTSRWASTTWGPRHFQTVCTHAVLLPQQSELLLIHAGLRIGRDHVDMAHQLIGVVACGVRESQHRHAVCSDPLRGLVWGHVHAHRKAHRHHTAHNHGVAPGPDHALRGLERLGRCCVERHRVLLHGDASRMHRLAHRWRTRWRRGCGHSGRVHRKARAAHVMGLAKVELCFGRVSGNLPHLPARTTSAGTNTGAALSARPCAPASANIAIAEKHPGRLTAEEAETTNAASRASRTASPLGSSLRLGGDRLWPRLWIPAWRRLAVGHQRCRHHRGLWVWGQVP